MTPQRGFLRYGKFLSRQSPRAPVRAPSRIGAIPHLSAEPFPILDCGSETHPGDYRSAHLRHETRWRIHPGGQDPLEPQIAEDHSEQATKYGPRSVMQGLVRGLKAISPFQSTGP